MSISINNLPSEVLQDVMSYLSPQDLCRASRVCKLWNAETNDNHLWKRLYLTRFPNNSMKYLVSDSAKNLFQKQIQLEENLKNKDRKNFILVNIVFIIKSFISEYINI